MPTQAPTSRAVARKHQGGEKPPNPADDAFPAKLSRLIDAKRKGRTDAEIAEAAGMSPAALSRLLTGGVPDPRLSTLLRVLKALGASLADYERA